MAQERRSTRRTGGGPPLRVEYTSYEEELRQIMPREIVEGINVQDTDSPSFAQGVDSPGPQLSPIPTATPPPSVRDSATEEQAGPSSYQAPQVESLQMSPEPDEQTIITLETVDAPVSGFQDVAPGPAEAPAHQQPAPQSMDPAREMAQSIAPRFWSRFDSWFDLVYPDYSSSSHFGPSLGSTGTHLASPLRSEWDFSYLASDWFRGP
ncbi:uncharacterized protein LOC142159442 [Mixophyes fleayi]|uniref:uncharacterized protein LOC142159442 n=1 Tax=Mixophyes fleayi TaxID=3061075 RepID=UPI003F4D85D0